MTQLPHFQSDFCPGLTSTVELLSLAAGQNALPRLGLRDHVATDTGLDRHSVLHPIHVGLSVRNGSSRSASRRCPESMDGLGYYARARNMHRAAQMVVSDFDGEFPSSVEALETLPGIGRSTAGAIVTLGHGGWAPILDGNVKRVLARFHAIEGWPGKADVLAALWAASESHTPRTRTADYTQGIMDLGATLCTKSNPGCLYCPMSDDCQARIENRPADFPGKKPKKRSPSGQLYFCNASIERAVFFRATPPTGIWGGLWSFPRNRSESRGGRLALRKRINGDWRCDRTIPSQPHVQSLQARHHAGRVSNSRCIVQNK